MRFFVSPASLSSLTEKKKVSGKLRASALEEKQPCTLYSTTLVESSMLFMFASRMASSFEYRSQSIRSNLRRWDHSTKSARGRACGCQSGAQV